MNLQSHRRVSEEYVITRILKAYEDSEIWKKSEIVNNKLPPSVDRKEWAHLTDAELLDLKMQISIESHFTPFEDMFGIPSVISPSEYDLGLLTFGEELARIIRLKREEELDPVGYREKYAIAFQIFEDHEAFSKFDISEPSDNFYVYRRMTDPRIYMTFFNEHVFCRQIMAHVNYFRSRHRNYITTAEQAQKDVDVQQDFLDGRHYFNEIRKGAFGIRTYFRLCMVEQAYWNSLSDAIPNDVITRALIVSSYLYGPGYNPDPTKYFKQSLDSIDWTPYRDIIIGINWRSLPGIRWRLMSDDINDVLECILLEGTKAHTKPMNNMVARYLYSPGSITSRQVIEQRMQASDIRSRLYEKAWFKLWKAPVVDLILFYNKYGAPFGLTIHHDAKDTKEDSDLDRNDILHACNNLLNILSAIELEDVLRNL